jgi:hypothetical protein
MNQQCREADIENVHFNEAAVLVAKLPAVTELD